MRWTRRCQAFAVFALRMAGAAAAAADAPRADLGVVGADAAPPGAALEERLAEIQRRVQRAVHYPASARARNVSGETLVTFEIASDGRASRIEASGTSGSTVLDRAALRAVEQAGPFPFVYGRITVPVRFSLRDRDAE